MADMDNILNELKSILEDAVLELKPAPMQPDEEIIQALQYGEIKPSDWKKGTIIEGVVTPEFVMMLLNMPKPADTEVYNKMTPFFTISFDNGISSAHYGTEVYF